MKTLVLLHVALAGVALAQYGPPPAVPAPTPTVKPAPYPAPSPPDPAPAPPPTSPPPAPITPAPTPDPGPWRTLSVNHDQVHPFPEPKPKTISEKAAVKYKPMILISHGCHPYPAVDSSGRTSGGLKPTGDHNGHCKGSGLGSQVYGRSIWFRGMWAIMYAWYFPKDSPSDGRGNRNGWECVVVWLDNPDVDNPRIMAVTVSEDSEFESEVPPEPKYLEGTRIKVVYHYDETELHALEFTTEVGGTQPLIMWEQLTENARRALNSVNWGASKASINDANFEYLLGKAWPFGGSW